MSARRTARSLVALTALASALGQEARAQARFVPPLPPPQLDAAGVDHSLDPPTSPPRVGAKVAMIGGLTLTATGLVGAAVSPRCATRAASGDCVDVRGAHPVFPLAVVVGVALSIAGHWAMRLDAPAQ